MIAPMHNKTTQTLLNVGHAMDHMMLLVFATAVTSIAAEFGLEAVNIAAEFARSGAPPFRARR